MEKFIVLLRGVNVGASRKLVMAELKAAMIAAGHEDCVTYIQSGNLVLSAKGEPAALEAEVEAAIKKAFGLKTVAIARSAVDFARIAVEAPFPDALPKLLHLGLTKHPLKSGALEALRERATQGERIEIVGDAVWIDFASSGVAGSKLSPAMLDKAVGSTLTARNINTVRKLCELAGVGN